MDATSASIVLATIFLWGVLSARAERLLLSGPIVFVTAGYVFSEVLGLLQLDTEHEVVKVVAEITLVWVLFSDAAKVDPQAVRSDLAGTCGCSASGCRSPSRSGPW